MIAAPAVHAGGCVVNPFCLVTGAGASVAAAAAKAVFSELSSWVATGATALVQQVLDQIVPGKGTAPIKPASWTSVMSREEHFMLILMEFVIVPMLLVATVGAIARADLARLGRTWLVALPVAIVSALAGATVTHEAMTLVDALSTGVLKLIDVRQAVYSSIKAILVLNSLPGGGQVAVLFVAVLAILACLLLWIELVIRNAAIYIALLFMPVALAGLVWPSTTRMAKRMVEMLVALVLSKFVIAAVLTLGANLLTTASGLNAGLTGAAVLLLAGFAPFTLLRMVPIIEAQAIGHMEGLSHRPFRAAMLPLQVGSMTQPLRAAMNRPITAEPGNTVAQPPYPQIRGTFPVSEAPADSTGEAEPNGSRV